MHYYHYKMNNISLSAFAHNYPCSMKVRQNAVNKSPFLLHLLMSGKWKKSLLGLKMSNDYHLFHLLYYIKVDKLFHSLIASR